MIKKFIIVGIIISIFGLLLSCNNKKNEENQKSKIIEAKSLKDLKEKYADYNFKDCDDFLAAGDEMIDVYIETINKAYEGDSIARKDLDRFDTFMNRYDAIADTLAINCPDKFEAWADKTDIRIAEVENKLMEIYMFDLNEEVFEYDEELERELQEDLEELNEQVEEALKDEII